MTWIAAGLLYVSPAHAVGIYDPYPVIIHPQNREICPIYAYNAADAAAKQANRAQYGLIKRIVVCVQGLVIPAAYIIMYQFSVNYIYSAVAAASTLAVALWGFLMVTGKNSASMRDAFTVALKIGCVSMFTYVMGKSTIWPDGLFPVMISIVDELAGIVTMYIGHSSSMKCAANFAPADVWGRIDCALNTLFGGIFNPAMLLAGLVGFFVSAFVSGTFGLFIALIGFAIIYFLVMAILRAAYITISAYVALALMAIISPIFITMVLFKTTYAYFEKWLKLTIGFMLQPLFLFAYLSMMLAAFDTVLYDGRYSIYRALISEAHLGTYPSNLKPYPMTNPATNPDGDFLIGRWLMDAGIYHETTGKAVGVGTNPRLQAHQDAQTTGLLGGTGVEQPSERAFQRKDVFGIGMNVLDNFKPINVYKVDIPLKRISWQDLAFARLCTTPGCTANDMQQKLLDSICPAGDGTCLNNKYETIISSFENVRVNYLIQVMLALLIALLTMYIFYLMLDMLPFIGAGIAGEKYSMPALGTGGLSMPGNKLVDKMKSGMNKLAGAGK